MPGAQVSIALTPAGSVTAGVLHPAPHPSGALLVLAHGAGAGQRHPFMIAMAEGLAARGVDVLTFDFPYMHAQRRLPDRAPLLEACFTSVLQWAGRHEPLRGRRVFIGGKSMGGRMATHLAAARDAAGGVDAARLEGVVVLGYPLHPPAKPQQRRVAHLPDIAAPVLIVQGSRDAFGTPEELAPVTAAMRAPVTLHVVAGGDHSFVVRGVSRDEVHASIVATVADWIRTAPAPPGAP